MTFAMDYNGSIKFYNLCGSSYSSKTYVNVTPINNPDWTNTSAFL